MADTVLGGAITLLEDFGFFDVILPFLLIFTIVFGILEKTMIFGYEEHNGKQYAKKNINAMVAFTIAFFFIAAKEVVASIQESLPIIGLILVAIVSLLMLIGSFASSGEFNLYKFLEGKWNGVFVTTFIVAIMLIFFNSFGWLGPVYGYFSGLGSDTFIIIIFLLITGGIVKFVFDSGNPATGGSKD
ncbi:MAG: hypothetical protein Q8Q35_02300 [Nanoarchaeota archaeon]|nr:hypothetical protein [Nanoarchaeota archaeon]